MKILWDVKDLGQSRQWPRLEYEVVCPCYSEISTTPPEVPRIPQGNLTYTWDEAVEASLLPPVPGGASGPLPFYYSIVRQHSSLPTLHVGGNFGVETLYRRGSAIGVAIPDAVAPTVSTQIPIIAGLGLSGLWQWKFFQILEAVFIGGSVSGVYLTLGSELPSDSKLLGGWEPGSYTPTSPINRVVVVPLNTLKSDGVNPIHMIDQLLFSKFPYGASRDRSKFNSLSIEVAAEILQSEAIRGGLTIADGESLDGPLSAIMQDIGLMIPFDPETGLYTFRLLRYGEDGPDLGADILIEYPENETVRGDRPIDTIAFTFRDRDRAYREVPIKVIDGGQLQENESQRAQKAPIVVTCDRDSVSRIAPRRGQEALGNLSTLKFLANHEAFSAVPASRFRCSLVDPGMLFVVVDVKRDDRSGRVEIGALVDTYDAPVASSGDRAALFLDEPARSPRNDGTATSLDDFFALEVPRGLAAGSRRVSMFLCGARMASATASAGFWLSRDGLSFYWHGNGPIVMAGELTDDLLSSGLSVDESSVGFTSNFQEDASTIEDLTLNEASWRAGRQVLLIGSEVIFLRNGLVTVAGEPCEGELSGLIRGRAGTLKQTHAAGTPFLVVLSHRVVPQTSDVFLPGTTLHYKAVAVETRKVESLDAVTEKTVAVQGLAMRPLTPSAVRLPGFASSYSASADPIRIDWCYHSFEFPMTGFGNQPCGAASGLSKPAGHFVVKLYNGIDEEPVVVDTTAEAFYEVSLAVRTTYSLDSGSSWSFSVTHVEGSFSSGEAEISINSY